MSIELFKEMIEKLKKCQESCVGKNKVISDFNDSPYWIVGEAPGNEEEIRGKPFVGNSGKLINKILGQLNIDRNKLYITNIIKCRPPNNRKPNDVEISNCSDFLIMEIKSLQPKVILALGDTAKSWFGFKQTVTEMQGKIYDMTTQGVNYKLIIGFHPSYILRKRDLTNALVNSFELFLNEILKIEPNFISFKINSQGIVD